MIDYSDLRGIERPIRFFEEIAKIPHTSENTEKIADYLVNFAKERGLEYHRDKANNVIIRKPATKGFEDRPGVILQGHTDMVEAKREGVAKDMTKEGLSLVRQGDLLMAEGTTLGGDDGVAVAYALALLDDDSIPHPEIEAVFTSDEEIGLLGAVAIDGEKIKNRLLINVDSDVEGVFTVGCAGGMRSDISLPLKRQTDGRAAYLLRLDGFRGGHSGTEIDKGRINAIKTLGEILVGKNILVSDISGGNADNAIPRSAECLFLAEDSDAEAVEASARETLARYPEEENAVFTLKKAEGADSAFAEEESARLVSLLSRLPSGVIAMSLDTPGMVETSLNLGILKTEGDTVSFSFSVRSAKGKEKRRLGDSLKQLAEEYGADYSERGEYPAWEYKSDSHLREVMVKVYEKLYGKLPEVITIHAGLECGIFSEKLEGLDCVSIGPDNYDIHTPDERLSLSSFLRVWEYIKAVLLEI